MTTYLLVHGGAHGGWCWGPVAERLRRAGHRVFAPTLTGLGERQHLLSENVDLEMHIHDVVNVIRYEDLHDIILVGHSYGGMVITGVADRVPERIAEIVFLDAAIPRNGEALVDWSPALHQLAKGEARTVDGIELVLWPDSPSFVVYGINDPVLEAWVRPKLTPHPWKCFTQPLHLSNEEKVKALPRTNINVTSTLRVRGEASRARSLDADRVWEVDTGHDLMLTEPEVVAAMLLKLADRHEHESHS